MKNLIALAALLLAGIFLAGCGDKAEETVAPDASALQNAQPAPAPPKAGSGGGPPPPSSSGLDPTK